MIGNHLVIASMVGSKYTRTRALRHMIFGKVVSERAGEKVREMEQKRALKKEEEIKSRMIVQILLMSEIMSHVTLTKPESSKFRKSCLLFIIL